MSIPLRNPQGIQGKRRRAAHPAQEVCRNALLMSISQSLVRLIVEGALNRPQPRRDDDARDGDREGDEEQCATVRQ
jgi:hypothetical protein